MRILMTTDTVGGVWTYTRELVLGLLDADESAFIFLVTLGSTANAEQTAWLRGTASQYRKRFTFETTTLPLEWQQDNAKAYIYAEPLLRRLAKSFAPDLFHSNQFCFGALPLSCPKVVMAHSDVLSWYVVVRGADALQPSPWIDQYSRLVQDGLAAAHAVVAPTYATLHDLAAGFGEQPRSHVIPNGRSVHVPHAARSLQAVTAGRVWDEAKGMAVLEDCLTPMPVMIAGELSSPEGSYDASRLRRRVLLGILSETHMLELFAQSAIYLVTSLYEPFGLAAVEAAQCGCAVVARDIPSQREVWGDDAAYFTGAESLCRTLERLSKNEERLHEAQGRALLRVRSRYLREHMTAGYLKLYRGLVSA